MLRIAGWLFLWWLLAFCVACESAGPDTTTTGSDETATPVADSGSSTATSATSPTKDASPVADSRLPRPADYTLVTVAEGFDIPVYLTSAPGDQSGRLFVVEKAGTIAILQDGVRRPRLFLDLRHKVGAEGREQGLLSMAFSPSFTSDDYFYVYYTDTAGDTVVARYRVTNNPNIADPASEAIILKVDQPTPDHNGGLLVFGPDGYLYIGLGDGGPVYGDESGNSQNTMSLLGTILRLDVLNDFPYTIPPSNPFVGQAGGREEIWVYGLRNPWRFAFDPLTDDLFIADVGLYKREEINLQVASSRGGENYGWNFYEGTYLLAPDEGGKRIAGIDKSQLVFPIAEYPHTEGCAIIGGYVYRGNSMPGLVGSYVFGDHCFGSIRVLTPTGDGSWQQTELSRDPGRKVITSFGQGPNGELYVLDWNGRIFLLSAAGTQAP